MALVAGVDSSTQSTKVVLHDLDTGELIAQASNPHPPTSPPVSEQDPNTWWDALAASFEALDPLRSDVAAISVGAQQHGLVLLDTEGCVLRPAKLWNDTTSAAQAERLATALSPRTWALSCGSVPVPAFTITKLAWVLDNEPELATKIARVMLPHDYLTWRLSGEHVTDRGDASGTGWFDPAANSYRPELLATVVDDPDAWIAKLPRVLGPTETAGIVTDAAADALGLPAGIPVGCGSGDNMAAALGLGLDAGDVAISLGTSGTVYARSDVPARDPSGTIAGFADATGEFLPLVCTLNATKVSDAVARWLDVTPDDLSTLALNATESPADRPVLVPYFDGERTPNRPDATGQWSGLRPDTSREALALSTFDGVLCGLLDGLDALRAAGIATDGNILLIGGGANSPAYRQRAADLTGRPVAVPDGEQLVATGTAVQAAAIVLGTDAATLARAWAGTSTVIVEPAADDGAAVRAAYAEACAHVGVPTGEA